MALPAYMDNEEEFWGHGTTSGNEDTFNRAAKDIWEEFEKEHEKAGPHIAVLTGENWVVEEDAYVGNGVNATTINLSDGGFDIKFIRIRSEEVAYTYFRSEDMAGDVTKSTEGAAAGAFTANWIESVGTGSFVIGDADHVNKNAIDYFYVVYGLS